MKIPYPLIFVSVFFLLLLASFGSVLGTEYYWLGTGILFLLIIYLNYRKFVQSFLYWILPSFMLIGVLSLIPYLGREVAKVVFVAFSTMVVVLSYYVQDKFFNGRKELNYKEISRILHYLVALFLLAGQYGVLFHVIENPGDQLLRKDILYWLNMIAVIALFALLIMSYLKLTLPKNRPRNQTIKIYSFTLSFFTFEVIWLVSYLSFRYIQSAILVFLLFFILLETTRYRLDKTIIKKNMFINVTAALLGLIVILATSKWGF